MGPSCHYCRGVWKAFFSNGSVSIQFSQKPWFSVRVLKNWPSVWFWFGFCSQGTRWARNWLILSNFSFPGYQFMVTSDVCWNYNVVRWGSTYYSSHIFVVAILIFDFKRLHQFACRTHGKPNEQTVLKFWDGSVPQNRFWIESRPSTQACVTVVLKVEL
jgi:hypothetical protein